MESKRRDTDKEEAFLQRQLRAETIKRANDKLYEQTGKMKLLRSNLLYAEVIEVRVTGETVASLTLLLLAAAMPMQLSDRRHSVARKWKDKTEQPKNSPFSTQPDATCQRN